MIVVVMGVSGSGKTTVAEGLARGLGWRCLDADSLHSPSNIDAMGRGIPLTDETRAPWLEAVHARMRESSARGEHLVVACSALKERYRCVLSDGLHVTWVYLKGSPDLIRKRMEERPHHYMKAGLLDSQFAALEEPAGAIVADITPPPAVIIENVAAALGQRGVI